MKDRRKFMNLFVTSIIGITSAILILLAVLLILNPVTLDIVLRYGLAAVCFLLAVYLIVGLIAWRMK